MSKGIFINNLETYMGWALYDEFVGSKPEESTDFLVYGTYLNKDSSDKPFGIKKMMKRSKPGLFSSYMRDKFDILIFDLHSNTIDDIQFSINALKKKPLQSEKIMIVISSFLSWAGNQAKMVPEKPVEDEEIKEPEEKKENQEPEEKEEDYTEEKRQEEDLIIEEIIPDDYPEDELDDEMKERRVLQKKIIAKRERWEELRKKKIVTYIKAPYEEEDFAQRIPSDEWKRNKEIEDFLLGLKIENLKIYIVCAGIPYGFAETVFNYHFKDAWLQHSESLPYFNEGNNITPTIHVKDLSKIIKMIIDKKPEQSYLIVTDSTLDKKSKSLISSISKGIGTGKTHSINIDNYINENHHYFDKFEDLFINPDIIKKRKIDLSFIEREFNWTNFLRFDTWLKPSKIIEEEFEWWSKDFNQNIPKLLKEFTFYRKLRPLNIILNCKYLDARNNFAIKLSKFFNIPIINYSTIVKTLSVTDHEIDEEELFMYKPFIEIKKKLDLESDESKKNELMFDALKEILRENVCKNRGYVLTGIPISEEEIKLLYWTRTLKPLEEGDEGYEPPEEGGDAEAEVNDVKEEENKGNIEPPEIKDNIEDGENQASANLQDKPKEEQENPINVPKKKIQKPIKYKTIVSYNKDLIPESVITIRKMHDPNEEEEMVEKNNKKNVKKNFEGYHVFFKVELFFQERQIEILDLILEKNKDEMFESMRIYIERSGRPFNYFRDFEDDIHNKRIENIKDKYNKKENEKRSEILKNEKILMESEREYWDKMQKRINQIKIDREDVITAEQLPTRKFLLLNIMPILTKGLLEVCKINPIDPIDHLADYLFLNSNDL